jgi:hypothetical protein
MTIEVTQEDRDLVMAIAMLVNDTGITIPERLAGAERLCARHRIEAQRPLLEALENMLAWDGRNPPSWVLEKANAAIKQARGLIVRVD